MNFCHCTYYRCQREFSALTELCLSNHSWSSLNSILCVKKYSTMETNQSTRWLWVPLIRLKNFCQQWEFSRCSMYDQTLTDQILNRDCSYNIPMQWITVHCAGLGHRLNWDSVLVLISVLLLHINIVHYMLEYMLYGMLYTICILYYHILYHTVLYYPILYFTILYYAVTSRHCLPLWCLIMSHSLSYHTHCVLLHNKTKTTHTA